MISLFDMGDDDFWPVVAAVLIIYISLVAFLGAYVLYSFNNAIQSMPSVTPQAQAATNNIVNTAVTILGLDPTTFFIAFFSIVGVILGGFGWAIFRDGGSGFDADLI